MKLDRDICLGGHFNKKRVLGIKINNHIIFPSVKYNHYILEIPEDGGAVILGDDYGKTSGDMEEFIDGQGGRKRTISNVDTGYTDVLIYEYSAGGTYELITTYFITPSYRNYFPVGGAKCVKEVKEMRTDLIYPNYLFQNFGGQNGLIVSIEALPPELTSANYMFANCHATLLDISHLEFNGITEMSNTFYDGAFNSIHLNKNFVTESVTRTDYMFGECNYLTTINGLEYFNTSNVTNMGSMFYYCEALTSLDVSSFDTSNVTDMGAMFSFCNSLTNLNVSSFKTSNVTDMEDMFYSCNSLTSLDTSNFNTSNVTDMQDMFSNCSELTELDLSSFNTSSIGKGAKFIQYSNSSLNYFKAGDVSGMFYGCSKLEYLDIRNFNFDNMKDSYPNYQGYPKKTNTTKGMFLGCNSLRTLRLDNCNNATIKRLISTSSYFPTNAIDGVTRTIYCKESEAQGLTPPTNWVFSYVD